MASGFPGEGAYHKPMLLASLLALGPLLGPPPSGADVYFEQSTVTSTDGRPGGPGVVSQVWCSGKRMRMEAGGAPQGPALILRLDLGKAWRVDPVAKTATEIDAERLRARSEMEVAMAGDLMGGEEDARTAPLTGGRTIAGYPCRGYRITSGSTVMDVYVTDRLPMGIDAFADFLDWSGASEALGSILREIRKLRGFPLETRTRVAVLGRVYETLSTVTKVKLAPHPAGLFDPPPGFTLVEEEPDLEP